METLNVKHASAMPAPTWSWLRMNDTTIEIPCDLARDGSVTIEADEALTETHASFERALVELQERLDAVRGDAADERACVRAAQRTEEHLDDLDTPALSAYQRRATLEEVACDVAAAFETGVGTDTRSYLNFLAGSTVVLAAKQGASERASIHLKGVSGEAASASVDAIAQENATLDLAISLDGVSDGEDARDGSSGLIGSELRVFAGPRSHVNITVYVTADDGFTVIDDSGFVLDEGARVTVRHVVLGGGITATGLAADLRGDTARIDIDTRYLAAGADVRDFNYVVRHRGRKTISEIMANGVLAGTSKKVLRGTIDLVHGCKGSEGTERETVLLASQGVDNKTVPTILCDEDDVAGNHGATIGHVRPDQLFYLESRGVSPEAAEGLFMRAKLEDAFISAPDDIIRDNVCRLGSKLFADFEEDLA